MPDLVSAVENMLPVSPMEQFASLSTPESSRGDAWGQFAVEHNLVDELGQQKIVALKALEERGFLALRKSNWSETIDQSSPQIEKSQWAVACDVGKIVSTDGFDWHELSQHVGEIGIAEKRKRQDGKGYAYLPKSITQFLIDTFDTIPTVDGRDFKESQENQIEPLFIIPDSSSWTIADVRNTPGLIGIWEVKSNGTGHGNAYTRETKWETDDLDMGTYATMTIMFHPRYADFKREQGVMTGVYGLGGDRKKVNGNIFKAWKYWGEGARLVNAPVTYLAEKCPQAFEEGGITKEDFRLHQGSGADQLRIERRPVRGRNGTLSHMGGTITLGSQFLDTEVMILENDKWAAIVKEAEDEHREVVGVLQLDTINFHQMGKAKHANIPDRTIITPDELVSQFSDGEAFRALIEQPEYFLKFSRKLEGKPHNISLVNMPLSEQVLIAKVAKAFDSFSNDPTEKARNQINAFEHFLEKNGREGLRLFELLCDSPFEDLLKSIEVGNLDGSSLMLENVNSIMNTAQIIQDVVVDETRDLTPEERSRYKLRVELSIDLARNIFLSAGQGSSLSDSNTALYILFKNLHQDVLGQALGHTRLDRFSVQGQTSMVLLFDDLRNMNGTETFAHEQIKINDALDRAALLLINSGESDKLLLSVSQLDNDVIIYRLLSRLPILEDQRNKIVLHLCRTHGLADQVESLQQIIGSKQSNESELVFARELLSGLMGLDESKTFHPDIAKFYKAIKGGYQHNKSNESSLNDRHALLEAIIQRYGIQKKAKIRDLGSGTGNDVGHLLQLGFADVMGVEYVDDHVAYARELFGDHFDQGSWFDISNNPNFQDVDLLTWLTRTDGHANSANRKRAVIRQMKKCLNPGGYAVVQTATPNVDNSVYMHNINAYRDLMRHLGMSEEEVKNLYYVVDSPDGENFSFRAFFPIEWYRKMFETEGLEVVDVFEEPMPHLNHDKNSVLVVRSKPSD